MLSLYENFLIRETEIWATGHFHEELSTVITREIAEVWGTEGVSKEALRVTEPLRKRQRWVMKVEIEASGGGEGGILGFWKIFIGQKFLARMASGESNGVTSQ